MVVARGAPAPTAGVIIMLRERMAETRSPPIESTTRPVAVIGVVIACGVSGIGCAAGYRHVARRVRVVADVGNRAQALA